MRRILSLRSRGTNLPLVVAIACTIREVWACDVDRALSKPIRQNNQPIFDGPETALVSTD